MMLDEIKEDLKRAKKALESAKNNFSEGDILTAANRTFVACENSAYVLLKLKFGSTSITRAKILTRLKDVNPTLKDIYDRSYDLRVQADYGRNSKYLPLTKGNLNKVMNGVEKQLDVISKLIKY